MAGTAFGTFEELLADTEAELRPIVRRLRELILAVDPDAVEVVRLGDRAASYGVGPAKMSEGYAYVLTNKAWVNLGFYHAVDLPDPEGLLEGTGARMRHVKVRSFEDADAPAVRLRIAAAVTERKATGQ